jgi:IS5 family transposase
MAHMSEALNESKYRFDQLQDIDSKIPWEKLVVIIEPHFIGSSIGRNLVSTETMLRIYFMQLRYNMSAIDIEEALFQVETLRKFSRIEKNNGIIPHSSCIGSFTDLVNDNNLEDVLKKIFNSKSIESD